MPRIDNLLKYAASIGASDVHLAPAAAPMLRLHGQLKLVKGNVYSPQETASLVHELLTSSQKEHFDQASGPGFLLRRNRYRPLSNQYSETTKRNSSGDPRHTSATSIA